MSFVSVFFPRGNQLLRWGNGKAVRVSTRPLYSEIRDVNPGDGSFLLFQVNSLNGLFA